MQINPIIMNLKNVTGIKVFADVKNDDCSDSSWITFNIPDERPDRYADDEVVSDETSVNVHLFIPVTYDYSILKETIKNYLETSGFFNVNLQILYEADTKLRHIVYEAVYTAERI